MDEQEVMVPEEVTEPVVESAEAPKTFTQEDVDRMVNEKLDEVLPRKIARKEEKIRREYENKYGALTDVLRAGTGEQSVEGITSKLKNFYTQRGVQMPQKPILSDKDTERLAQADAAELISGDFEDVVEEVERLKAIGAENMTARQKKLYLALNDHIKATVDKQELGKRGVTEDVYNSPEFKAFAAKFASNTPVTDIYDIYRQTLPKKEHRTMGSMKQTGTTGPKDFYTPEEIARLTEEDLDDPKVWEAVRRSMTGR